MTATNNEKTPWYSSRSVQWFTAVAIYFLHLSLSKQPVRIVGLEYDTVVGGMALLLLWWNARKISRSELFRLPDANNARFRIMTMASWIALFFGYLQTGKLSLVWEDTILELSNEGWPITVYSAKALQVLFSHLSWSSIVVAILAFLPFPNLFYPRRNAERHEDRPHYWFTWKSRNWLHWASVGFLASHVVFAVADAINHWVLPTPILSQPNPSVVSQLVVGDWIGCIAPCVTAPFLEELLYRGFLWPAVTTLLGNNALVANMIQSLVFSAHHVSTTGGIPLAALGFFWAWLYRSSGSLATVVAVHVMWNARVFVSAWLLGG